MCHVLELDIQELVTSFQSKLVTLKNRGLHPLPTTLLTLCLHLPSISCQLHASSANGACMGVWGGASLGIVSTQGGNRS